MAELSSEEFTIYDHSKNKVEIESNSTAFRKICDEIMQNFKTCQRINLEFPIFMKWGG